MAGKFSNMNLYEYIGVEIEATVEEIRRAYRRKALECHPDKNPDDPKAAETFHLLSSALEVLTDPTARQAYNTVFKAKKAAELRSKALDSKRKKLKTDLEQREQDALLATQKTFKYSTAKKTNEEFLQDEIDRLRKEGSKLLEEELAMMREALKKRINARENEPSNNRIKIKWKAEKDDVNNGGYTREVLLKYLNKYGDIVGLVMSKKNGSALAEFATREAAEMALAYEKGNLDNCLSLEWISPQGSKKSEETSTTSSINDFESLVLRKLRQAEERRRLIEQIQKEDLESQNNE